MSTKRQNYDQNYVSTVANTAGISLNNSVGTLQTGAAVQEYAQNAAGNIGKIAEIAKQTQDFYENQNDTTQPSVGAGATGPSFSRSVLGAGAVAALGVVAPAAAAVAGAVMAVSEAINYAVGHAAVDGAKGSMTLANSAATFDDKDNMVSYKPACEDVTYDVATGQKQKQAPLMAQGHNNPKLAGAVAEHASQFDEQQIAADVRAMLDKQMKDFGWAQGKMKEMGLDGNGFDPKMAEMSPEKPRPRGLNVGMGAPSFG